MNLEPFFNPDLTDKNTIHSYLPVYEDIMNNLIKYKKTGNLKICEVGVQRGGSILGWLAAYPESKVYGIDIDNPMTPIQNERFTFFKEDAYSIDFVEKLKGHSFDMLIDDGSHKPEHILFFAEHYPQFISEGGICIIEDIPSIDLIEKIKNCIPAGFVAQQIDLRYIKNRWDDVMILIYKN